MFKKVLALSLVLVISGAVMAETIVVTDPVGASTNSKQNHVYSQGPDFTVANNDRVPTHWVSFLKFDLADMLATYTDASQIESATLKLSLVFKWGDEQSVNNPIYVSRMTQAWQVGQAGAALDPATTGNVSFFTSDGTTPWVGGGGSTFDSLLIEDSAYCYAAMTDFVESPAIVGPSGVFEIDVTDIVKAWVGGESEYGFGLTATPTLEWARTSYSAFGLGTNNPPVLTIVAVPEPATMALLGFGGIAALIRRRK